MSATIPPRPAVAEPGPWSFPVPHETTLDNGIRLLTNHLPGQYVVSVRVAIPLRLSDEPRRVEGVATVMARLLDEGTADLDSEQLAELLERKGIALGAGVTEGSIDVDFDVPQRFLPDALEILRDLLSGASFPERELQRIVDGRLAQIEQERASAPHRAARELVATLYADTERASRPTGGSVETVSAITRDDVVTFHRQRVGPRGAIVAIAGDLDGVEIEPLVDRTLGRWVAPDHVPPALPTAAQFAADRVRVVIVDRPGSVQSELAVAAPGPDRHAPDWPAYPVLGFVVGGSPNARVDAVLREEKGYTYGIRSGYRPRRVGGTFVTTGSVRSEVTAPALGLLVEILEGARDGFTDEERSAGVDFVTRTAPGRFATADAVADEVVRLALDELPLTRTTETLAAMRSLTIADLDAAYARYVTGEWTVVVVGDATTIADPVRALGLGELTVVPA